MEHSYDKYGSDLQKWKWHHQQGWGYLDGNRYGHKATESDLETISICRLEWGNLFFFKYKTTICGSLYLLFQDSIRRGLKAFCRFSGIEILLWERKKQSLVFLWWTERLYQLLPPESTFLDKKYFVRFKFDLKLMLSPEFYSYDEDFQLPTTIWYLRSLPTIFLMNI